VLQALLVILFYEVFQQAHVLASVLNDFCFMITGSQHPNLSQNPVWFPASVLAGWCNGNAV